MPRSGFGRTMLQGTGGLLAVAALLLLGCGQSAPDVIVIRSSFWGMTQEAQVWKELAERFQRAHPNIRVQLEHITGQNYHAKVLAMTVGHCAPDVLACDDEPFRGLAANGLYEDLTPYLQADKECKPNDFYPVFRDIFTIDNKVYALPY